MNKKSIRDSYSDYKKGEETPVDVSRFLFLTSAYNQFLVKKVLEGEEVTLPSRLGTLSILGKKIKIQFDEDGNVKNLAPDWVKTKRLWENNKEAKEKKQRVFHTNDHTDSIRYKYLWSKKRVLVENKTLYALRMTRNNKRAVSSKIIEGKEYLTN